MKASSPAPWIDVSRPLSNELGTWPGDTPFRFAWTMRLEDGASVNLGKLTTSPHGGTHLDAPLHYTPGGTPVDQLPLDLAMGPAWVVDARGKPTLGPALLRGLDLSATPRVLFRTDRWRRDDRFPETWPCANAALVAALAAAGVRLFGVDVPSVDRLRSRRLPVHQALAAAGICILESLDLSRARPGRYELVALPLRLRGAEASPVRAILRALS